MKATLRIPAESGYKDIEVDITEEELAKLAEPQKTREPTGYERVNEDERYYCVSRNGSVEWFNDNADEIDVKYYSIANYYSSELVAENNARADKLMRQLRRFAVEHRGGRIDWANGEKLKYNIHFTYDYDDATAGLSYNCSHVGRQFVSVYFDSEEAVKAAIEEFHDELIWYFTEYRDSL